MGFFNLRATAHTLPISYVFLVSDQDYVHLELSFNPFELTSFSDWDANKNGRLDPEELAASLEKISRQILDHLVLSADGKPVTAETSGLSPDADTHHATLRAHYRVDASHAALSLESTLQEITSSSHLSQVNFLRDGKPQLAQLDSQSHKITFVAAAAVRTTESSSGRTVLPLPRGGGEGRGEGETEVGQDVLGRPLTLSLSPSEGERGKPPNPSSPSRGFSSGSPISNSAGSALPMCGPDCSPANSRNTLVALGAAFAMVIFVAFRQNKRNTLVTKPESLSPLNQPPKQ